ncbi:hypothetical protein NBH19_03780 [Rhizobium sp. S95]|uniref:Uncharacterized protein n=1 Tax=Ciceribacter sichuanensis TaxID=2949647 RepID=A0AAJ1FH64_9HYPH|nr:MULTISPECIES: hypothetical protein [unclassified Ciceribacter]MCM2395204.1 hypothetical protein [Ciceribacter sp. S95]MCO5955626.1 hypothetical protein [Ciceribacter sp. S101]
MGRTFELSGLSEQELTDLIDEATSIRAIRRADQRREASRVTSGAKRHDMKEPTHHLRPTPTTRHER